MCGIYGSTIIYDTEIIKEKLNSFRFRGPDFQKYNIYSTINTSKLILGHNRLSIIDLDERSGQPFEYNKNIVIVFNGEIYNFKELKLRFFPEVQFRTTSDTEILCAMYELMGIDCLKYLNGMFAFVIFDRKKNQLIGARDRLGKKPFYYWNSERGFEFSSQLKAILIDNKFNICVSARIDYLINGCVPDPLSIVEGVYKLRAGNYFKYNLETKEYHEEKYWDVFDNSSDFIKPKSFEDALETLDELLLDAVKIRMISDVPIGTFLSGGVDSSLVTSYVSKLTNKITAYSIGFEDRSFDESSYAKEVARQLKINHQLILCDKDSVFGILDDLNKYYDEPFADNSAIPTALLCQETKKYITVALGGDGADELFFGYNSFKWVRDFMPLLKISRPIRLYAAKFLETTTKANFANKMKAKDFSEMVKLFLGNYNYGAEEYDQSDILKKSIDSEYLSSTGEKMTDFSNYYIKTYLNNIINTKTDRASMRSSLELRSPIMDFRIVEYSKLIPLEFMYDAKYGGKKLLKTLLYKNVTPNVFKRRKQGFAAPVVHWFRNELKINLLDTITTENMKLLPELNSDKILFLMHKHIQGQGDYSSVLWQVFMYLNWHKKYREFISN